MRALVDAIEAGAFGDVTGILHIGIGGSVLGPALLVDALGRKVSSIEVQFLSNIDGAAFDEAVKPLDPATTLIVVASKTFTTLETLTNLDAARDWLRDAGVDDPDGRVIAVTAKPEAALEQGIDETRILVVRGGSRRPIFAVELGRRHGRAGARLGCFRSAARRRGGDGPPFPLRRSSSKRTATRRLRRPFVRRAVGLPDPRGLCL